METVVKKLYEGMFLVNSAQASDWETLVATIKNILEKAEAEVVSIRKWDERKLAYEIGGKVRGTYVLCYFMANGQRIQQIERDIQLSERIMRVLILRAEHMTQQDIEKEVSAAQAKKHGPAPAPHPHQSGTGGGGAKIAREEVENAESEQTARLEQSVPDADTSEQPQQEQMKDLEQTDEQGRKEPESKESAEAEQ